MPDASLVLHSPERTIRAGPAALLAAFALREAIARSSGADRVAALVTALLALAYAALEWRSHLLADDSGVLDRYLWRHRRLRWSDVVGFDVGLPGGLWGGHCVRGVRLDGSTVDLLSLRAYSSSSSRRRYDELHRMAWTLDALRQHQDNG